MQKKDIVEGGHYTAKVGGKLSTVRVDKIRGQVVPGRYTSDRTVYDVTNLATNRKTTFRSAQKFRCVAKPGPKAPTWRSNADSRMDLNEDKFAKMREVGEILDKLDKQHAELRPRYGEVSIGGAHMDPFFKAEGLRGWLRAMRSDSSRQEALATGKSAIELAVRKWNDGREYQVHRDPASVANWLELLMLRIFNGD